MKRVFTKQEAIVALRKQYNIPEEESVDIDSTNYWYWPTIVPYTPNTYPNTIYCNGVTTTALL